LVTSFVNAFVNFDFEPLLLVITQHQLDCPSDGGLEPTV
jgi:hypothetical protein